MTAHPGWYPDTQMAGTQRYWDGVRWTEHVAPLKPGDSGGPEKIEIGGIVMAALLPGIGIIVGLIMLIRRRPMTGVLMIAASILSLLIIRAAFVLGQ